MTRKIALVGTANSADKAPYNDKSWSIWGVSARGAYVTRADRWFELHRLDGEPKEWADAWRKAIKKFSGDLELLMLYPEYDLGPRVRQFPHERLSERFGTYFMSSSFSWMMAMAIDELRPINGRPVDGLIGIWGVDMEQGTEYAYQRAGFRHFIDLAKALGIPVQRLASSGLAYEPIPYPLWQDDPALNKAMLLHQEADEKVEELNTSLQSTRSLLAQTNAKLSELESFAKKGYNKKKRKETLTKMHADLMSTSSDLSKDLTHWGAVAESHRYWEGYLRAS